jgi:cyanophycinase
MYKEGRLLIIGGNEDKTGDCIILNKFVEMAGGAKSRIAVMTTATKLPDEVGEEYREIFLRLGANSVDTVNIEERRGCFDESLIERFKNYSGIFFTGGDQLRLTSILGGSKIDSAIRRCFFSGGVIGGTSAGASVMSHTMIVGGDSSDTPKKAAVALAEGMGLLGEVIIDQHFAQRGRINRLLAAVAQNPNVIGVGIDEDTALCVEGAQCSVIGSQTVTILDGREIVHSNISESSRMEPLALTYVKLHILPSGFGYDINKRFPYAGALGRIDNADN